MTTRTEYASKNITIGIISKMLVLALSFIARTFFIYTLGRYYLGVNGLYTEVLRVLSLAELGFGSAFSFALFKPIAENNEERIKQLLSLFKKVYLVISLLITVLGLALVPFLQFIVRGADFISLSELRLYFLIYLVNTIMNYFVAYKFTYVNAAQKNYINTTIDLVTEAITVILQVISLLVFKNFLIFLLIKTTSLVFCKIISSFYLNRKFKILASKPTNKLPSTEKKLIFKEVKGLAVHQFSTVAIHSTDNIIISSISALGVGIVGLVSNYNLIITSITGFVLIIFTSITSGLGNIVATENKGKVLSVFNELNFLNAWIYGFCSLAFLCLIPPFITIWLGKEYLIDSLPFCLIVINCYLEGQCTIYNSVRIATGNFNKDKWISFSQAIINLIVSIFCAMQFGLVGVYIGTITSRLFFTIFRPIVSYKYVTGHSPKEYFKHFIIYFLVNSIMSAVFFILTTALIGNNVSIRAFITLCVIVAVIPNLIFHIIFSRTKEYANSKQRVIQLLRKVIKK